MGKTRDLLKKTRYQGNPSCKDRQKCEDLTEAEEVKKRWQEYTEELYKIGLMTWVTTMMWSLT